MYSKTLKQAVPAHLLAYQPLLHFSPDEIGHRFSPLPLPLQSGKQALHRELQETLDSKMIVLFTRDPTLNCELG